MPHWHIDVFVSQPSKGMRRAKSSGHWTRHLAGVSEPIIQRSRTPQRCFNSQALMCIVICGLLIVSVTSLCFKSAPIGFGRIKFAEECVNLSCDNRLHLLQLLPPTSFSQQSCTNYTEGNCEFCSRLFFLSFDCVHARSLDELLYFLFFCCHIKSD